jgi:hypothetical protein
LRWPKSLAEGPRQALRYMKDNLDEALLFDFETARDHEAGRLIRLTTTADHKEGGAGASSRSGKRCSRGSRASRRRHSAAMRSIEPGIHWAQDTR